MCIGISCFSCGGGSRSVASNRMAKVFYLAIFVLFTVLAILLRYVAQHIFPGLYSFAGCKDNDHCLGVSAVYRVSFVMFAFFAFLTFATMAAFEAHTSWWTPKLVALGLLLLVSIFIPNPFFFGYRWLALVLSIAFIVVQVLVLLDFAFDAHEYFLAKIQKVEEEYTSAGNEAPGICGNSWALGYIGLTVFFGVLSLGGIILMYAVLPSCAGNVAILSETLILGVITLLVSMTQRVSQGALPPVIVWAYCVFLAYGAISNNPTEECNPAVSSDGLGNIIAGLIIATVSIAWSTFRAAAASNEVLGLGSSHTLEKADSNTKQESSSYGTNPAAVREWNGADKQDDEENNANKSNGFENYASNTATAPPTSSSSSPDAQNAAEPPEPKVYLFHLIIALGSCYLAMLLSGWGTADEGQGGEGPGANPEASLASMWVRFGAQILCQALYVWILFAPFIFPEREFGATT